MLKCTLVYAMMMILMEGASGMDGQGEYVELGTIFTSFKKVSKIHED